MSYSHPSSLIVYLRFTNLYFLFLLFSSSFSFSVLRSCAPPPPFPHPFPTPPNSWPAMHAAERPIWRKRMVPTFIIPMICHMVRIWHGTRKITLNVVYHCSFGMMSGQSTTFADLMWIHETDILRKWFGKILHALDVVAPSARDAMVALTQCATMIHLVTMKMKNFKMCFPQAQVIILVKAIMLQKHNNTKENWRKLRLVMKIWKNTNTIKNTTRARSITVLLKNPSAIGVNRRWPGANRNSLIIAGRSRSTIMEAPELLPNPSLDLNHPLASPTNGLVSARIPTNCALPVASTDNNQ